jgi:hypothetical protein
MKKWESITAGDFDLKNKFVAQIEEQEVSLSVKTKGDLTDTHVEIIKSVFQCWKNESRFLDIARDQVADFYPSANVNRENLVLRLIRVEDKGGKPFLCTVWISVDLDYKKLLKPGKLIEFDQGSVIELTFAIAGRKINWNDFDQNLFFRD